MHAHLVNAGAAVLEPIWYGNARAVRRGSRAVGIAERRPCQERGLRRRPGQLGWVHSIRSGVRQCVGVDLPLRPLMHFPRLDDQRRISLLGMKTLEVHILHWSYSSCISCERNNIVCFVSLSDDCAVVKRALSNETCLSSRDHLECIRFPRGSKAARPGTPSVSSAERILEQEPFRARFHEATLHSGQTEWFIILSWCLPKVEHRNSMNDLGLRDPPLNGLPGHLGMSAKRIDPPVAN